MKKAMWIIAMLALAGTVIALQFMPDTVPMHYNAAGEIDRWGSKLENLIFPGFILAMCLFWQLFGAYFEKKAEKTAAGKAQDEARTNAKILVITGAATTAMFAVMQTVILYSAYVKADVNAPGTSVDIARITAVLAGVLLVVISAFLPKTGRNRVVGVRVRWSMYNDVTWQKSNRFGAGALIAAGLLTIAMAAFLKGLAAMIVMPACLLAAVTATLIYAHGVYKKELEKEK